MHQSWGSSNSQSLSYCFPKIFNVWPQMTWHLLAKSSGLLYQPRGRPTRTCLMWGIAYFVSLSYQLFKILPVWPLLTQWWHQSLQSGRLGTHVEMKNSSVKERGLFLKIYAPPHPSEKLWLKRTYRMFLDFPFPFAPPGVWTSHDLEFTRINRLLVLSEEVMHA